MTPIQVRPGTMDADVIAEMERDDYRAAEFVRDGDIVLDVGAYNGAFAAFVRRHAPLAKVICLEPIPSNFAALCQNVGDEATLERLALSGRNGPVQVYDYGPEASACHSIYDLGVHGSIPVEVEAVTLDTLLERHSLPHVRFLKLDCQGAEYEVIPSTSSAVLRRIDYIAMEVHDAIAKTGEVLGAVPGASRKRSVLYRHLIRTHVPIEGGRADSIQVWARRDLVQPGALVQALRDEARVLARLTARRLLDAITQALRRAPVGGVGRDR